MFIAGFAFAVLAVAPALAADLPPRVAPITKAPVAPVVPYTWTGCYVGINGGYGTARKSWFDPQVGLDEGANNSTGGAAGGQIGCDYQVGYWVFGIQGMGDWASLDGSHPYTDDPRYVDHSRVSAFATVTGRVGFVAWDTTLFYAKGGGAWVRDKFTETCSPAVDVCPGIAKVNRSGWAVGAGVEHMFAPNWSVFFDYTFMDFGRRTASLVYTDGTTYDYGIKQDVQTFLAGINYRFGGPVVARY